VLAIEMNIDEIPPASEAFQAFKAQAVAARTVASWKAVHPGYILGEEGGRTYINNSTTGYQAFIPGYYNDSQVANKSLILQAISDTPGQYLSYFPDGTNPDDTRMTIDAEFGSDMLLATQTEHQNPGDPPVDPFVPKGYLTGVQDPISTADCFVSASGSHDYGMSQRGAMRWARGKTCPNGTGGAWPVSWTDYRQILAHYYTGIDILNGGGGKVTPDDRWNLLWHDNFGSPIGTPPTLTSGTPASIQLKLQNTSSASSPVWDNMELGYQWVSPAFTSDWQLATIGTGNTIPPLPVAGNPPSTLGQSTDQFSLYPKIMLSRICEQGM
jgi:hypothetical protein